MKWVFPKNNGGRDSGFHDAGVETFKGNLDRYLARELIQNSLDARLNLNKPVHVKFEILEFDRSKIPSMDDLAATLQRCAEYWSDDEKALAFFEAAAQLAAQPRLKALKVGDYNTTGVAGSDTDRSKNWYHLIRCAGSSSKWGGEGGSFGIGKNAPFAASRLRTVLYSTLSDGACAFQGVATLVSHKLPDGTTAQPTGFLGGDAGESIRTLGHIPHDFRRTEKGTDIVLLEYPATPLWQNDLIHSILENFWPAIEFGDLTVTVGDQTIDKSNLSALIEEFSGQEDFTAHFYYKAYKLRSQAFHDNLPRLKEVSLYLYAEDMDLPKQICMVRKTGMVIYKRGYLRSVVPFCGVFVCRNDTGNALLREMEPPRHDIWDPDHPEKGANKRIEAEYMAFIRECIKKLIQIDDSKIATIPGLNRFLPDDDDSEEESFDAGEATSKGEAPDRSPLPEKIEGKKIDPRHQPMQPDASTSDGADEMTEIGEGEGTGGAPGEGENDGSGGNGSGGGGIDAGNATTDEGAAGGSQSKPAVPIRYRAFVKSGDDSLYELLISRSDGDKGRINVLVSTVGDDQKAPAEIESARLPDGTIVPIAGPGMLGPLNAPREQTLHLEVKLSIPRRVAMEVSAHEA